VDGTALKVFKYNLTGSLLGSWSIDAANKNPTGITINPTNVSDIWIVDKGTLKVYQYVGAATRTSGSQNAAATFALNSNDMNPQGIADPPVLGTISVPAPTAPATISAPNPVSALETGFVRGDEKPGFQGRNRVDTGSALDVFFAFLGNGQSAGQVNQITQRPTERYVPAILPPSPEAAPILAARTDAVFAGSQQAAEDVVIDMAIVPDEDATIAIE
jgi:hypothetical protein